MVLTGESRSNGPEIRVSSTWKVKKYQGTCVSIYLKMKCVGEMWWPYICLFVSFPGVTTHCGCIFTAR